MIPLLLLLLALLGTATAQRFYVPRPRIPPKEIVPVPHPRPVPGDNAGAPVQQQMVIQTNVARLEDRFDMGLSGLDLATELLNAILGSTASPASTTAAKTTTKGVSSASPTPTSFNMALFQPCKSYATKMKSCAAQTTSFFTLPHTEQASCACYTTSYDAQACRAVPTRIADYDDNEAHCWAFFNDNGFSKIADAMGTDSALPGPSLCAAVQSQFGLSETLEPSSIRSCETGTSRAGSGEVANGGGRMRGGVGFRHPLATYAMVIGFVLGAFGESCLL